MDCLKCERSYTAGYSETFGGQVPIVGCLDGKFQVVGSDKCHEYPKTGDVAPTSVSRQSCTIVWEGNTNENNQFIGWYRCKTHGGGFSGKPFDPRRGEPTGVCSGWRTAQPNTGVQPTGVPARRVNSNR